MKEKSSAEWILWKTMWSRFSLLQLRMNSVHNNRRVPIFERRKNGIYPSLQPPALQYVVCGHRSDGHEEYLPTQKCNRNCFLVCGKGMEGNLSTSQHNYTHHQHRRWNLTWSSHMLSNAVAIQPLHPPTQQPRTRPPSASYSLELRKLYGML